MSSTENVALLLHQVGVTVRALKWVRFHENGYQLSKAATPLGPVLICPPTLAAKRWHALLPFVKTETALNVNTIDEAEREASRLYVEAVLGVLRATNSTGDTNEPPTQAQAQQALHAA